MVCLYGPMPVDDMAVYKVTGQITDEQNQPLDSMRVHFYLDQFVRTDDFHSDSIGEYNAELWTWKGADTLHLVVYDPKKEYDSYTTIRVKAHYVNNAYEVQKTVRNVTNGDKTFADTVEAKVGDTVEHKTFGQGLILSANSVGGDMVLEIAFDTVGTKKLMATYAKLRKI